MTPPPSDRIVLESPTARLTIDPASGGRMSSLVVAGSELLVTEGMGPIMWGCYPMAPFAGRIRDGRFTFDGREVTLPRAMPPHAIHGTVLDRAWTVDGVVHGARHGEATLSIDLGPDWPFEGRVSQRLVLGGGGLQASLRIEAAEPMPASMGWHPWFRRTLVGSAETPAPASRPANLSFDPGAMYERGADGLPTGRLVPPSAGPWDDCFTDVRTPPRLVWPDRFALEIASSCDHWVVYTEPDYAICVEPQTGPPGAVERDPVIAAPDAPLTATMTWHWWPLGPGASGGDARDAQELRQDGAEKVAGDPGDRGQREDLQA
jgi:aldose 1-epimerase